MSGISDSNRLARHERRYQGGSNGCLRWLRGVPDLPGFIERGRAEIIREPGGAGAADVLGGNARLPGRRSRGVFKRFLAGDPSGMGGPTASRHRACAGASWTVPPRGPRWLRRSRQDRDQFLCMGISVSLCCPRDAHAPPRPVPAPRLTACGFADFRRFYPDGVILSIPPTGPLLLYRVQPSVEAFPVKAARR